MAIIVQNLRDLLLGTLRQLYVRYSPIYHIDDWFNATATKILISFEMLVLSKGLNRKIPLLCILLMCGLSVLGLLLL